MSDQELALETLADDAPPLVEGRDLLLLCSAVAAAATSDPPAAVVAPWDALPLWLAGLPVLLPALLPPLAAADTCVVSSDGGIAAPAAAPADTGRGMFCPWLVCSTNLPLLPPVAALPPSVSAAGPSSH